MDQPINEHFHFAMVELIALEEMNGLIQRAPAAARLLVILIRHMRPGAYGVVVCSRETMRQLLGTSMPTLERALRVLIEEKWLHRTKIGGAHALAINRQVAWVDPLDKRPFAVFDATVIASRSEQDAIALDHSPLRQVPTIRHGEEIIPTGPGLDPPSQPGLEGMPGPAAVTGAARLIKRRVDQVSALLQQRIDEIDNDNTP